MRRMLFVVLLALPLSSFESRADQLPYQKPPQEILDVLNAPALPALSVNPSRIYATLSESERYPGIDEVSEPMLRLAGIRIDPRFNGLHLAPHSYAITLVKLPEGTKIPVALPPHARAGALRWSPNGKMFAFTNIVSNGIELWIGDAAAGKTHRVEAIKVNAVLGEPIEWLPDNKTLLVKTVPARRGPPPAESRIPKGPAVQESDGKAMGVETYEDLLQNPRDEDLFEYYATAQLVKIDAATGAATPLGKPGILDEMNPSPDGKNILITREHRPFSYLHPYREFPKEVDVWNTSGAVVYHVASLPLPARIPLGGVQTGPRQIRWVANQPAAILWVEALDGGNPKEVVPHRDRIMAMAAPFEGQPMEIYRTEERFAGIQFGKNFVLVEDQARISRLLRTFELEHGKSDQQPKLIWSRNAQDRYKDPGRPVEVRTQGGRGGGGFGRGGGDSLLMQSGDDNIILEGAGASPNGDHPFLDRFNLTTLKSERVFECPPDKYEEVVAVLDDHANSFITRRESPTEPPNYFLHTGRSEMALTDYKDPAPQLRRITKQLVTYQRADGVPLSMELYLPPDYKPGTRLPAVMWAYPREYNDADTAGQIEGSPNRFTTITGYSELFFLLDGYAVLENAAMPVVGTIDVVNNTYVEQIVADAKAAIDKAAAMGVVDPHRVGVGGHSYGAFMTANLLANAGNLFRAGIAESGAYNRTLTPFGFQSERRAFWEAKDTYTRMSPFFYADKIKDPILLIHGEADDNSGTFPIQSDRMYQAIRGNGGTVRLVFLPDEAHGYRAKETIEHVLWEKFQWFDKYVKHASPMPSGEER
ncbi:MAG TPA: prolyl oligopeptidase family serine peptidase [Bryobacteraceae bacterium]|nr:prolyl oligopeptidase family serine peptidase [Bryobacteraceae bacterium]